MKEIRKHLKRYRSLLALILGLSVLQVVSGLLTPTILSTLVSQGIMKQNQAEVYRQGGWMFGASLLDLLLSIVVIYLISKFSSGLARDLRQTMFRKIQYFSMQDFQKFGTSSYINRTTRDIQTLSQTIGYFMRMLLMGPIMLIGSILLAIRINYELSLVLLASVPILTIGAIFLIVIISKEFTKMRQLTDVLTQIIRDTLTGIRVIRAFNKSGYEMNRFEKINLQYRDLLFRLNLQFNIISPVMMITINFANLAVVLVGAYLIQNGSLEIGGLMAVIQYSVLVLVALLFLSFVFVMIPQAFVSAKRIEEVLAQDPMQTFPLESSALAEIETIEFKQVSFSYEGAEKQLLTDLSFTARTGDKIAIIGSTGSGKSTLMNLLLRFLDASKGEILYNGINIEHYTEAELRKQISFVPQSRLLFSGTIRDNLQFGNPGATDEEMIQALKMANAWEFVSELEDGLDARVEQKGENFSGGQKQRLAIARSLVKPASIRIFDDSFSALDAKTEAQLRQNLIPLNHHSIVFVVAQKISSVIDATKILVLEEGKLVGVGTHEELAKTNEIYQSIMNSQPRFEEKEESL